VFIMPICGLGMLRLLYLLVWEREEATISSTMYFTGTLIIHHYIPTYIVESDSPMHVWECLRVWQLTFMHKLEKMKCCLTMYNSLRCTTVCDAWGVINASLIKYCLRASLESMHDWPDNILTLRVAALLAYGLPAHKQVWLRNGFTRVGCAICVGTSKVQFIRCGSHLDLVCFGVVWNNRFRRMNPRPPSPKGLRL
jgi:hypothetical protein